MCIFHTPKTSRRTISMVSSCGIGGCISLVKLVPRDSTKMRQLVVTGDVSFLHINFPYVFLSACVCVGGKCLRWWNQPGDCFKKPPPGQKHWRGRNETALRKMVLKETSNALPQWQIWAVTVAGGGSGLSWLSLFSVFIFGKMFIISSVSGL